MMESQAVVRLADSLITWNWLPMILFAIWIWRSDKPTRAGLYLVSVFMAYQLLLTEYGVGKGWDFEVSIAWLYGATALLLLGLTGLLLRRLAILDRQVSD